MSVKRLCMLSQTCPETSWERKKVVFEGCHERGEARGSDCQVVCGKAYLKKFCFFSLIIGSEKPSLHKINAVRQPKAYLWHKKTGDIGSE